MHIDLRLLRPAQIAGGPLVQVNLDGVLFQDYSFYGPNRLDSRRTMTAWEMQAQRDRKYFKAILAARGIGRAEAGHAGEPEPSGRAPAAGCAGFARAPR